MHEQKLVEVSLTRELLEEELEMHSGVARETLEGDMGCLARMEEEGERFGAAVGLDSVSTFENIVEGFNHFFMEMNTRIQVEHGVTELAYRLKFVNPDDPKDYFFVERLIEAMALLSLHGPRLPRPVRVMRHVSGIEVRINATNIALQPHAGGVIKRWSPVLKDEWRDDQGIGTPNPDTGAFVFYNLAGAYDSNIALALTHGLSREDNLERMAEILRRTELRGDDLQTNLPVHRGLISWMLGKSAMVKPNTRFMTYYLAAVGALQQVTADVDLDVAAQEILRHLPDSDAQKIFRMKQTLLLRPLRRLLANPHGLAGFIGRFDGELWKIEAGKVRFAQNPMRFLQELYHYLNLEDHPDKPPCEIIWSHDERIMEDSMMFYGKVTERTGVSEWHEVEKLFEAESNEALTGADAALWERSVAAHRGFQVGLEILLLIPRLGLESGFTEVTVGDDLEPVFPEKFTDAELVTEYTRALAPAPKASSDEIVTPMGGAFFAREAPHLPILVGEGEHFEAGQPLFIIEVMKMFNKVLAPFSGTLSENLMKDCDGKIVSKGQVMFKIEPDERIVEESEVEISARRRKVTLGLLQ